MSFGRERPFGSWLQLGNDARRRASQAFTNISHLVEGALPARLDLWCSTQDLSVEVEV